MSGHQNYTPIGYEIEPKYKRIVKDIELQFIRQFYFTFPGKVSPKGRKTIWAIDKGKVQLMANIVSMAALTALEKEKEVLVSEEKERELEVFREKIADAKNDLDYIEKGIHKTLDEEI